MEMLDQDFTDSCGHGRPARSGSRLARGLQASSRGRAGRSKKSVDAKPSSGEAVAPLRVVRATLVGWEGR